MSFRVPDDDCNDDTSLQSTPDFSRDATDNGRSLFTLDNMNTPSATPSATPAKRPPSSQASNTPAGAPSASFLGSSLMNASNPLALGLSENTSAAKQNSKCSSPLGRSMRSRISPKPSRLREELDNQQHDDDEQAGLASDTRHTDYGHDVDGENEEYQDDDDDDDDDDEHDDEHDDDDDYHEDDEDEDRESRHSVRPGRKRSAKAFMEDFDQYSDAQEDGSSEEDIWLDKQHDQGDEDHEPGDDSDLIMMQTPAADDRVFREAEDIFRAISRRPGAPLHPFQCATLASDIYRQSEHAVITEPPELILDTESLIMRLYKDGVGPEYDTERMDETLAAVTGQLTGLWAQHVDNLPLQIEEHATEIGPPNQAGPLYKAVYLATLVLQLHHSRTGESGRMTEPMPETLFRWLSKYHNPYPNQVHELLRQKPCTASHVTFWPTVCMALLRGQVTDTQILLQHAGWELIKDVRHGGLEYTGRALKNIKLATQDTIRMLELCPAKHGNWEIWTSDWTLFRIKARAALEQLRHFTEGKNTMVLSDDMPDGQQSLTAAARKAESQLPWEIYEHLNILFEIALGNPGIILTTAQDWCEATIGLVGWWDETRDDMNMRSSTSRALVLAPQQNTHAEDHVERLARSFHKAVASGLHFNSLNPVEVGMACIFEDNAKAVIAILRTWSLPIAAAVAEIAALGRWLPQHQPWAAHAFKDFDVEDLDVLDINPTDPDEMDGVKDNTLIQYAQELANYEQLSSVRDKSGLARNGWEVAIHVLGRMDSPQRSEDTVGELVDAIMDKIDVESSDTIDRVWRLLIDLGMVQFAEQVAAHFGDLLRETGFCYGKAIWYYGLAHQAEKVRDVIHFLMAYSLIQSAAYPAAAELDDQLRKLLKERNATLERLAKQDLEAAEIIGQRVAGYATLRKFYEIRDDETLSLGRRRESAAAALTILIASADDSIRGGLYDASRDAIVGEDFLLALLGEALVFVDINRGQANSPLVIHLEQLDVLLKAVEDMQTVGSGVYETCNDFFQLVLASAPALLKGSTPADVMERSRDQGSMVPTDSSMLASQLHRSMAGASPRNSSALALKTNSKRGWDWRSGLDYSTSAEDILRMLRLGLTKDLAKLWLAEVDGVVL